MTSTPLQLFFQRHPELVQSQVAAEVDISQSHLSLLISGDRQPSFGVANRLLTVMRRLEPTATLDAYFGGTASASSGLAAAAEEA